MTQSRQGSHRNRVRNSKSGQVTLPAHIRRRLGVEPGEQVSFVESSDGTISIEPVRILKAEEIAGRFGRAISPEELQSALQEARHLGSIRDEYSVGIDKAGVVDRATAAELVGRFGTRPDDPDVDNLIRESTHKGIERRVNCGSTIPKSE